MKPMIFYTKATISPFVAEASPLLVAVFSAFSRFACDLFTSTSPTTCDAVESNGYIQDLYFGAEVHRELLDVLQIYSIASADAQVVTIPVRVTQHAFEIKFWTIPKYGEPMNAEWMYSVKMISNVNDKVISELRQLLGVEGSVHAECNAGTHLSVDVFPEGDGVVFLLTYPATSPSEEGIQSIWQRLSSTVSSLLGVSVKGPS